MQLDKRSKWLERLYAAVAILLGISLFIGLLGKWLTISKYMPEYMTVYVLEETATFYAPPYILGNKYPDGLKVSDLKSMTVQEANAKHFSPDKDCEKQGFFTEVTTLNYNILLFFNLTTPNPSRWNADGSWNW